MGGTSLSVLSPHAAEGVEPIVARQMAAEGLTRYEPDPSYWYSADGLPYGYDIQAPDAELEAEEIRHLELGAGTTIHCDIVLHIFVSDLAGRPALARVAQRVAHRTDGWVFVEFHDPPTADLLLRLNDAGRCIRAGGAVWLDAAAMTAWLTDANFHVIK
ncbi:hypothetical protein ACWKSP_12660 [Micromonosporaceae bacterium Da 78-11]